MPGFKTIQNEIDQLETDYFNKRQLSEAHKQRSRAIAKRQLSSPWVIAAAFGIGIFAAKARLGQVAAKMLKTVAGPDGRNVVRLGRMAIGPTLAYIAKRSAEEEKRDNSR